MVSVWRRWVWVMMCWPILAGAQTLTVGLGELDYPPFYFTENGRLQGAAVEIAEAVADDLGYDLTYLRFPWGRVQYFLSVGQIDMVILYFKTPERARDALYTDRPHLFERSYLAVRWDSDAEYSGDLRRLSDYRFVNVRGYWHGDLYQNATYLNKSTVNNELDLIQSLLTRDHTIGVGNKPALLRYADELGVADQIRFLSPPIDRGADYMAFSKANARAPALAREWSRALDAFMQTPAYRALLDKYHFD